MTIFYISVIFGVLGAFVIGLALGTRQNDFTNEQLSYITGVAFGAALGEQSKNNPEVGDPHQLCIKEYYPDHPIKLAGCIEVLDDREWKVP